MVGFAVILMGTFVGTFIINWLRISHFGKGDVKDTLLIAFLLNAARSIIHLNFVRANALVQQKEAEIAIAKAASTKAQLEALSSQINPHFLFNSLNAIAGLALVDGKKTMRMTVALSKLLRYNLDNAARNLATVGEEMEVIKTYLEIEKIRFGDGLNYIMDVSEESTPFLIPRFLLQPLVENSIKHAFYHSEHPIFIKIIISVTDGNLVIAIHDNGNPFPETIVPGHGMKNVSYRLQLLFPDKYEMQISNLPEKEITVRLLKR
jgi:sensor histidine kinase YesM